MSGLKDLLLGSSGTPARVEDLRDSMTRHLGGQGAETVNHFLAQGGLPGFQGPMAAPVSGPESSFLSALRNTMGNQQREFDVIRDSIAPMVTGAGSTSAIGTDPGATGSGMDLIRNILSGQTMDPATNPALQANIEAAQRPIREQFADQLAQTTSQATQAGHTTQAEGSSPFAMAESRLQGDLAGALGDVSADLVGQNMNQERQRQMNLLGLQTGAQDRGMDRQLSAIGQTVPLQRGQITNMIEGLNAQALPRMVQERGIDRGMEEFGRQQNTFLQMIQQAMGANQPQAVSIPGQEGGGGLLGPMVNAAATAFGGPAGAAAAGALGF